MFQIVRQIQYSKDFSKVGWSMPKYIRVQHYSGGTIVDLSNMYIKVGQTRVDVTHIPKGGHRFVRAIIPTFLPAIFSFISTTNIIAVSIIYVVTFIVTISLLHIALPNQQLSA